EAIKDEIANNINIENSDFEYGALKQKGGIGGAYGVFGDKLGEVIEEMNRELVV
ncbi:hypothetical protein EOM39_06255, partial [Candidatus Gracilibacteria bacterium]|nr:hypothetical protein [Candidatus Gracilibacteria bacterium]